MINVTFTANGFDISPYLSTYDARAEVVYSDVVETMDGTEHAVKKRIRYAITAGLIPMTASEIAPLYAAIDAGIISVTFTDENTNTTRNANMRVTSNIGAAFALHSITGNNYYKGAELELREL